MGNLTGNWTYKQTQQWLGNMRASLHNEPEILSSEERQRREDEWRRQKEQIERERQERNERLRPFMEQSENWRSLGLCIYCGGEFNPIVKDHVGKIDIINLFLSLFSANSYDYRKCDDCGEYFSK